MNTQIRIKHFIFIAVFGLSGFYSINAQNSITTDFENYNFEQYDASGIKNLVIHTKHADISILNWQKDSISIETTLEILSNKPNLSKEMMEKINNKILKYENTIKVKTEFNSDFNSTIPYRIKYTILCPEKLSLNLENKYGKVTIENMLGSFNTKLKNCEFTIKQVATEDSFYNNNINLSFCKGLIKKTGSVTVNINNSNLSIDKIDTLKLKSSYNKIKLNNCKFFSCKTNIDNLEIQKVNKATIKGSNSIITIHHFNDKGMFELTNGALSVKNSGDSFKELTVNNNNTITNIKLSRNASFVINGEIKNGNFNHNYSDNIKTITDNNIQSFIGTVGSTPSLNPAKVIIFNQNQNVNLK